MTVFFFLFFFFQYLYKKFRFNIHTRAVFLNLLQSEEPQSTYQSAQRAQAKFELVRYLHEQFRPPCSSESI